MVEMYLQNLEKHLFTKIIIFVGRKLNSLTDVDTLKEWVRQGILHLGSKALYSTCAVSLNTI